MALTEQQQAVAKLIAQRLRDGIMHPGDPERNIAPTPIMLPFQTRGRPKEMSDLVTGTVKLLSEAIVSTIVVDADVELVPRAEVRTLRAAAGEAGTKPNLVPVHCRCDTKRIDPLAILTVTDPDCIVVDARPLLRGLHGRTIECPHERVDDE